MPSPSTLTLEKFRKKVYNPFRVFFKQKTSLSSSWNPPDLPEPIVVDIPVDAAGAEKKGYEDAIWTTHFQRSYETFKEGSSRSRHDMESTLRLLEKNVDARAPLKSAVRGLVICFNLTQVVAGNDEEYEELAADITGMAGVLVPHISEHIEEYVSGSVARILKLLRQETMHIWQQGNWGDMSSNREEREYAIRQYRRIMLLIHQLHSDISLRNWDAIREPRNTALLEHMLPVDDARYNSSYSKTIDRHECAATTCKKILDYLKYWAGLPEGAKEPKVFWMTGTSGTGKTTISYSFCKWLEENGQLGGNYFCSRTSPLCRNINNVIPTLAYQLSQYSPAFRSALCEVLEEKLDVSKLGVNMQFEKLIQKPMQRAKTAIPENVVIVIDALDECDTEASSRLFIDTMQKFQSDLPIKFFVANRPEHVIGQKMLASGYGQSTPHLHDIIDKSVEDIESYITEALGFMSPLSSAKHVQVEQLAQRAWKLFIYAATAVRYIHPNGPDVGSRLRLQVLLGMVSGPNKQHNELDKLYSSIISLAVNPELREEQEANNTLLILRTVVQAKEPMAITTLASLLRLPLKRIYFLLKPLRSLLHVQNEGLVVPFHTSFIDFLLDKRRSGEFNCETASMIDTSVTPTTPFLPIPFRESHKYYQDSDVKNLTDQIQKLGQWPYAHGGYADIWQAIWQNGSQSIQVAVKVLRVLNQDVEVKMKVLKRLRMEVRVWHQLRHKHVVPMFGVCEEFGEFPSMVSAWYENGHIMAYLQKLGEMATVEKRLRLLIDIACGLDYLHTFPFPLNGSNIIHGDLKGANILVNANGEAALADFGLSAVITVAGQSTSTLTSNVGGSIRWMAPELLSASEGVIKTCTSDIYSFGSVVLEVLTGENPYRNLINDVQVITALHRRIKPERPTEPSVDPVWDLMERCWSNNPRDRPSMSTVLSLLERYYEERNMSFSPTNKPSVGIGEGLFISSEQVPPVATLQ